MIEQDLFKIFKFLAEGATNFHAPKLNKLIKTTNSKYLQEVLTPLLKIKFNVKDFGRRELPLLSTETLYIPTHNQMIGMDFFYVDSYGKKFAFQITINQDNQKVKNSIDKFHEYLEEEGSGWASKEEVTYIFLVPNHVAKKYSIPKEYLAYEIYFWFMEDFANEFECRLIMQLLSIVRSRGHHQEVER